MKILSLHLLFLLNITGTAFVCKNLSPCTSLTLNERRLHLVCFANLDKDSIHVVGQLKGVQSPKERQQDTLEENGPSEMWMEEQSLDVSDLERRNAIINLVTTGLLGVIGVSGWQLYRSEVYTPAGFQRLSSTQFIAALGDPKAHSGTNARSWGLWRKDPGPRGVFLSQYDRDLIQRESVAPAGWKFDPSDWWIEEHGLIMESPDFPMPAGRYLVTGGRSVSTGLTVKDNGEWRLDDGATLGDVTHLPCRSARYQPLPGSADLFRASPVDANPKDFPVRPGAPMPSIPGTQKQDYAVLFVIGKATQR